MIRIAFPEIGEHRIDRAIENTIGEFPHYEPVKAELREALTMLRDGKVDAVIAGRTHTSLEVIKACQDILGKRSDTTVFSGNVITGKGKLIADVACCKKPDARQLKDIIVQAHDLYQKIYHFEPAIAVLSYSTQGSGGWTPELEVLRYVVKCVKEEHPEYIINGEVQLDVALDWEVADEKQERILQGEAEVLICPDLNSGNILYKAMSVYAGETMAGPILTGFNGIVSDLSRGSGIDDIEETIKNVIKLINERNKNEH